VKEWSPTDHDKGKLWTLAAMAEFRTSISLGVTNDTSANCQGCVDVPLQTCVLSMHTLFSFFTEIGIGNQLLKSLLGDWVDLGIKTVPDDESEARFVVYKASRSYRYRTSIETSGQD
jgi:hypothetical protein